LPNSISYIEKFTFNRCENLATIVFPNTVCKIDDCAFENCSKLTTIFPKHLNFIGFNAFANCKGLVDPEIPNSTIMSQGSFCDCNNLLRIIKNQLNRDYQDIFKSCYSL
jgi:hypothetical protein